MKLRQIHYMDLQVIEDYELVTFSANWTKELTMELLLQNRVMPIMKREGSIQQPHIMSSPRNDYNSSSILTA
jgi:hypothetical protein